MNSLLLALLALLFFLLAYTTYGSFLRRHIFTIREDLLTPAHVFEDGVDFVPTSPKILIGHHFMSMAGVTPILGPAIAVIYGWVPALIWVVLGTLFLGATHDLGSLAVSLHHQGRSIGDLTDSIIGPRARILFLLFLVTLLWILLMVSLLIIITLFETYPEVVFPFWFEIPVALLLGYYIYRKKTPILIPTLLGLIALLGAIYIGLYIPITMPSFLLSPSFTWALLLLALCYLSSILPVWSLLQPRDHINAWQVYTGLALALVGILIYRPMVVAPAFNPLPEGAPPLFPILFVTIAGGAISGYHSLVSSGITVKQLKREEDARPVVYGGMLLEGFLAVLAILACTAGFASTSDWNLYYAVWDGAGSLTLQIRAFVEGLGYFMALTGIPERFVTTLSALIVVSFAATTLDSATRIQRYLITELASSYDLKPMMGHHGATLLAVLPALLLFILNTNTNLLLWSIYGSVNHLLAGLVFLLLTLYLYRQGKPIYYTLIPMVFMLIVAGWALLVHIRLFVAQGSVILAIFGGILFILELWLILEAISSYRKISAEELFYLRL